MYRSSQYGSVVTNPTNIHEDIRVQSLASLSGLRIQGCLSSCVGGRGSSDRALLWLWCRPAVAALIRSLAWELPYVAGVALKSKQQQQKKKKLYKVVYVFITFFFWLFKDTPLAYGPSRLGVESELWLPAYTTATAMQSNSRLKEWQRNTTCDLGSEIHTHTRTHTYIWL